MDIKTRTSALILTLLLTSSVVVAMDAPDSDELSTQKAKKSTSSRGLLFRLTGGRFDVSPTEQLLSSSALTSSTASSSIDQDTQPEVSSIRPVKVLLKKVTEGAVVARSGRIVTVFTDNRMLHTHQVETKVDVKSGEYIKIIYDIFADEGEIIKVGLLNSVRDNWYPKQILLKRGRQKGTFTEVVPEGEKEATLTFYNVCETSGSTRFTIRNLNIEVHKSAPPTNWTSLLTFGFFGESPIEPSSSGLVPSPVSSSSSKDLQSATSSPRLVEISLKKASKMGVTGDVVVANSNGFVTVLSDNRMLHTCQVKTSKFSVSQGERIEITYDIITDAGEIIKVGLLNSQRNNFYPQQVLLTKGRQEGALEEVVPEGECKACLMFYNVCETSASTQFTIRSLKIKIFPSSL